MVLLAAAVCNKGGKVLVSRHFVEMTRARIEGLLAAFPKLMNTGKQHTLVETESVRYVYQALEQLFVVLITTKASNILEDLETLRLFARVVPEYGRSCEESAILDNSFQIIFAFDEIVALGYRESVNLAQINTFIQMDSHEEKVAIALRETQEREAKQAMREKQKEFDRKRKEAVRHGGNPYSNGYGGSGISSNSISSSTITNTPVEPTPSTYTAAPKRATGTGMKLGGKKKDVNNFVDQLASEGVQVEEIPSAANRKTAASKVTAVPEMDKESVHTRIEEKITCVAARSGALENLEIIGTLFLLVTESDNGNIAIKITDNKQAQTSTHPSIDKKLFQSQGIIAQKDKSKSFPLKQEIGVLRWRLQTTDESVMPLTVNCWPNVTSSGCDVNIEYELQAENVELDDVIISIPLPGGVGAPRVTECDGDYEHDGRKNILSWTMPVINQSNSSGTIEFSIPGHEDDFFPVTVSFLCKKSFFDISAVGVKAADGRNIKFSQETISYPERYDIV